MASDKKTSRTDRLEGGEYIGLYPWSMKMEEMFRDVKHRVVDFEFFRPYFEKVELPADLAKPCLDDLFSRSRPKPQVEEFVKFLPLSTLRKHSRLPTYADVAGELVDHRSVKSFRLQGDLSVWGGEDSFAKGECLFVSHRWASADHPDPDGRHLTNIFERLDGVANGRRVLLWIDFCCLPQRGRGRWSATDEESLRAGIRQIPGIVKGCDLMILGSSDYLSRAWCYSELFAWLCKLSEVDFTRIGIRNKLFRSLQTKH